MLSLSLKKNIAKGKSFVIIFRWLCCITAMVQYASLHCYSYFIELSVKSFYHSLISYFISHLQLLFNINLHCLVSCLLIYCNVSVDFIPSKKYRNWRRVGKMCLQFWEFTWNAWEVFSTTHFRLTMRLGIEVYSPGIACTWVSQTKMRK